MLNQNFEQSPVFNQATTKSAIDSLEGLKSQAKSDATKSIIQEQIDGIVNSQNKLEEHKLANNLSAVAEPVK